MTDLSESLSLARTDSVLIERPDRASLRLGGADVRAYLHAVTSQHLADRAAGEVAGALLLSAKGRIEFELRCAVLADGALLDTDAGAAPALGERLRRYVFRYDVRVGEPLGGALTVAGPRAGAALEAAGLPAPPAEPWSARLVGDGELVAIRTRIGVDLIGPSAPLVAQALRAGAPVAPAGTWEVLRVERGVPRWGAELTDDVLAEEAGLLDDYVHLRKGCYPGQETVARVHNLGQVQRRLAGLRFTGAATVTPGIPLQTSAGARAGVVRSAVRHPELGTIGLGLLRRTVAPGELVVAGDRSAEVTELPFQPEASAAGAFRSRA